MGLNQQDFEFFKNQFIFSRGVFRNNFPEENFRKTNSCEFKKKNNFSECNLGIKNSRGFI